MLLTLLQSAPVERDRFVSHLYRSRREYRRTCETAGKSGKQIERCVISSLLKRFFDALIGTVFSDAPGKDGIVISIEATKVRVGHSSEAGADLEIIEIEKVNLERA
jgi:hypothetical protein